MIRKNMSIWAILSVTASSLLTSRKELSLSGTYRVLNLSFSQFWALCQSIRTGSEYLMRKNAKKRFRDRMLLIRDWPAAYYIVHTGENGLPVIDKKIENVPYFSDVEEFTLTEMEFYFLAELNTMLYFSMDCLKAAKKQFIKFWEFRYIR